MAVELHSAPRVWLTRLARPPIGFEEPLLYDGQDDGQKFIAKLVAQHVKARYSSTARWLTSQGKGRSEKQDEGRICRN